MLLLISCGRTGSPQVLRLAHGLDTGHPVHLAMEQMGERLAELSGGDLTLRLYPSEQLGSERECLELLQIGSIDLTKVSASVMAGFAPLYEVFGLPYLFRDREHAYGVLDGPIGRRVLESSRDRRLLGLGFYDAGSRSFYTRDRPVHTPEDLEGLKIRTQESSVAIRMVEALGGAATPIAWGELYTALQQGVVDGAENNPPSFHLSRHYEVARYFTLDEHTSVPDVLVISTGTWERLEERQRDWLRQAVAHGVASQRSAWRAAEEEALAAVQQAGVEVIRPDTALFATRTRGLLAAYRERPDLGPLLAQIEGFGVSQERSEP